MGLMLVTGATGLPVMVAVWALVKPPPFALYLGFRTHRGNRRRVCFYCRAHIVGLTDAPLEV